LGRTGVGGGWLAPVKIEVAHITCAMEENREREKREKEQVTCRFKLGSIMPTGLVRLSHTGCFDVTGGHVVQDGWANRAILTDVTKTYVTPR
jgi:hypothetical protein